MYIEDELLLEEEIGFLNFTKVQKELKNKVKTLKILIGSNTPNEINSLLKEIENILEWYC